MRLAAPSPPVSISHPTNPMLRPLHFFHPFFCIFFYSNTSLRSFHPSSFHSITLTLSPPLPLHSEYLVGASPEMFVRIEKTFELPIQATSMCSTTSNGPPPYLRVETCPISGTVARGRTALEPQRRHRKATGEREGEERADDVHGR